MTFELSEPAAEQLLEIVTYIAQDNRIAAAELASRIFDGIEQLVQFPRSARLGLTEGTRELLVVPYRITYEVKGDVIYILSIIHGKRKQN